MAKKSELTFNWTLVLGLVVITLVYGAYLFIHYSEGMGTTRTATELETFYSKNLKLTVQIPGTFTVEDALTNLIISKNAGKIFVSRTGTNFSALDDFLVDLSEKNHFTLRNKQNAIIPGYDSLKADIEKDRYYYIYTDNWVYSFWTTGPTLFKDLDQIAKSFRYTP